MCNIFGGTQIIHSVWQPGLAADIAIAEPDVVDPGAYVYFSSHVFDIRECLLQYDCTLHGLFLMWSKGMCSICIMYVNEH